jgi:hypothetical protein
MSAPILNAPVHAGWSSPSSQLIPVEIAIPSRGCYGTRLVDMPSDGHTSLPPYLSGHHSTSIGNLLDSAEGVRNRVIHGKRTPEHEKREAIVEVIQYAEKFNEIVYAAAKFRPFGDLKGFQADGQSLSKAATRWVLKGMDFSLA